MSDNLYERWGIDPLGGPDAITARMRELMEDAEDEPTRRAIRAAWEELTLHPARRLRAALGAHPDSHGSAGAAPPGPPRMRRTACELELFDLLTRPRPSEALPPAGPPPDLRADRDPSLQ